MDAAVAIATWFCFSLAVQTYAVPPDICFHNFRWEDCGRPPTPVIYYYKSGSRCEVGMWRGCTPNLNMFQDEYECVQTCIFAVRAHPENFHNQNDVEEYDDGTTERVVANITKADATTDGDAKPVNSDVEGFQPNAVVSPETNTNPEGDLAPEPEIEPQAERKGSRKR